jgi:molybdate transport repressor ModE-like protein
MPAIGRAEPYGPVRYTSAMDLTQLRYLRAVARDGSITGAARTLKISQSTLSQSVRQLEEELGTALFLRARDGVRTTEAGALLVDRAEAVLALVDVAESEIRELGSEDRGRFVLGCHDSLGGYFLPEFLAGFLERWPRIELSLWNASSAEVRDAVVRREVHFGLVVNTVPHPDLVIVDCYHDEIQILGAPPAPATREEAEARLRAGALIWPARAPFEDVVRRLAAENLLPERRIPCGDLGLARSLALGGLGSVVLPVRVAQDVAPGGLVQLHPDLPRFRDTIHLVWRGDLPRTRAAARVREQLVAHGRLLDRRHGYRGD